MLKILRFHRHHSAVVAMTLLLFVCFPVSDRMLAEDILLPDELPPAGWEESQIYQLRAAIKELCEHPENQNYDALLLERSMTDIEGPLRERRHRKCAMVRQAGNVTWIRYLNHMLEDEQEATSVKEWIIDGDLVMKVGGAGATSVARFHFRNPLRKDTEFENLLRYVILPNQLGYVDEDMRMQAIRYRIGPDGIPEAGLDVARLNRGPGDQRQALPPTPGGDILLRFSKEKPSLPTHMLRIMPVRDSEFLSYTSGTHFFYDRLPERPPFLNRVASQTQVKEGRTGEMSFDIRMERVAYNATSLSPIAISVDSHVWQTMDDLGRWQTVSRESVPESCVRHVKAVTQDELLASRERLRSEIIAARERIEGRDDPPLTELLVLEPVTGERGPSALPLAMTLEPDTPGRPVRFAVGGVLFVAGVLMLGAFVFARLRPPSP